VSPEGAKETMPHTTTNLSVHFIFSTKQRCALIKPEFEKDLHAYLGGIVRQIGGTALLRQWHSRSRASSCAGTGKSIRRRRGTLDKDEFFAVGARTLARWQTGYGAFTVSESGVGAVRDYISNQQEQSGKVVPGGVPGVFEEERNCGG
jgi:putative transposase